MRKFITVLAIIFAILLLVLAGLMVREHYQQPSAQIPETEATSEPTFPTETEPTLPPETEPTLPPETEPEETVPPTTAPPTEPPLIAEFISDTDPDNWSISWDVIVDDAIVDSYTREEEIYFDWDEYFALPGISSFRGGNYRTDASYGTVDITEGTISKIWSMNVGHLDDPSWCGCGWTGQPLVVQWDEETKAIMNLYEEKKQKEGLTEIIYAKMDGYVHFIDMEDGSYTRDPVYVGMVFKGSGAIDPRGYPILYLGAGLSRNGNTQSIFAVSLIDGKILYKLNGYHSKVHRWWFGFDGAPLVDAETDTLIWAGESGLLYTIKLNTQYDKEAGTLTIEPDKPVMSRYTHKYGRQGRYIGYEASVTAAQNYLFAADNSGILQCIDINTMEIIWAQDLNDDINATPVFEWGDDDRGYLYVAASMDYSNGNLSLAKVDAQTGEIVWEHKMRCTTISDVPGGVLSSPVLGREGTDMEDLIIFSVGRSPSLWCGQVVALDKNTGEVVWQFETGNYMWSSPVGLYTEDGKGYLFQADASGNCYLLDGATGAKISSISLGETVEASPVAFDNHIVLGTRSRIYIFEIS